MSKTTSHQLSPDLHNYTLSTFLGAIWVSLSCAVGPTIFKIALFSFPPFFAAFLRIGIIACILLPLGRKIPKTIGQVFLLSITSITFSYALLMLALQHIDAEVVVILGTLEVPACAILAWIFFKERLAKKQLAGTLLSMIGIYFVVKQPQVFIEIKLVFCVVAAMLVSAFSTIQTKWLKEENPLVITTWSLVFATPQLLILSLLFEDTQIHALLHTTFEAYAIILLTTLPTAASFVIWTIIIQRHKINSIMPIFLIEPVFGVMFGHFFLQEFITLSIVLGCTLTVAGISLAVLHKSN